MLTTECPLVVSLKLYRYVSNHSSIGMTFSYKATECRKRRDAEDLEICEDSSRAGNTHERLPTLQGFIKGTRLWIAGDGHAG